MVCSVKNIACNSIIANRAEDVNKQERICMHMFARKAHPTTQKDRSVCSQSTRLGLNWVTNFDLSGRGRGDACLRRQAFWKKLGKNLSGIFRCNKGDVGFFTSPCSHGSLKKSRFVHSPFKGEVPPKSPRTRRFREDHGCPSQCAEKPYFFNKINNAN